MRTRLINIKKTDEGDYVYIGRPTKWGNPYIIGRDGTREEVIEKYRQYFDSQIRTNKTFREELKTLKGKTLACFCKPEKCHGDIIVEWLEGAKK